MSKVYTLQVHEDSSGELYIEIPESVLEETGWAIGDSLLWEQLTENSWQIKKDDSNA